MKHSKSEPMWRRYLRFFGPNVAADVNDEVDDHIARLESDLRATGLPDAEIDAAVRARFGDPDAIRARLRRADESRLKRTIWIDAFGNFGQDVAYAFRRLRQRPGFTAAVVIVLALGVGATTAMFSAVDAAMLRPLPFVHPEQLVAMPGIQVQSTYDASGKSTQPSTRPQWTDLLSMHGMIAAVGAYSTSSANLTDPERPVRVAVGHATAGLFALLGEAPVIGREFTQDEARAHGPDVAILSYGFWRSHFGGRAMLGQTIPLDGKLYTVVGIAPRGFSFPDRSDLWIPLPVPFPPIGIFLGGSFPDSPHTIARMQPGVSSAALNVRLRPLWRDDDVPKDIPPWMHLSRAKLLEGSARTAVPLQQQFVGNRRTTLLVLFGATGLLLLLVCANITNLLLAQAESRRHEVALRAVLGASRGRLVRQFLTESVLLAVGGAVVGLAIAPAIFRLLVVVMPPTLAGLAPPELDLRVLAFAAALAIATGVGFGLWPALGNSRADLAGTVRSSGRVGTTGQVRRAARRLVLSAELALSVILLVGAGLMLSSFARLTHVDTGFDAPRSASGEIDFGSPPPARTVRGARLTSMIDRLAAAPGVSAVGMVSTLPLAGDVGMFSTLGGEGVAPRTRSEKPRFTTFMQVSDGYFAAMGIKLLAGRTFRPSDVIDTGATAKLRVAVISKLGADSLWPGENPLGRWITYEGDTMTVVGVAANVRVLRLTVDSFPQVYVPLNAAPPTAVGIVVRGGVPPAMLMADLRDAVHAVDPTQPVYNVRTISDLLSDTEDVPRTDTLLIALFGGVALLIAVVGVYAVVAYSVAQRRRELGIRAALGATGRDLIALVSREMIWVMALGLAVGLAGAWAASRVLASLLFGVTTHDPATFVLAPLALIVPAAIATLIPARRAARTNPVDVIREE